MTYDSDLRLEVQQDERRIIVTMPGTPYGREFRLAEDGLVAASGCVPDEPQAPITAQEFVARAEAAAMQKALELGWCEKHRRAVTRAGHHGGPRRQPRRRDQITRSGP